MSMIVLVILGLAIGNTLNYYIGFYTKEMCFNNFFQQVLGIGIVVINYRIIYGTWL